MIEGTEKQATCRGVTATTPQGEHSGKLGSVEQAAEDALSTPHKTSTRVSKHLVLPLCAGTTAPPELDRVVGTLGGSYAARVTVNVQAASAHEADHGDAE